MGDTPFQKRVYDAVSLIPSGFVSTYKEVAVAIGCGSARAVGQALRRNPHAPAVPCHRVIASDLTLRGFYGKTSEEALAPKEGLLKAEGVRFVKGTLLDHKQCYRFNART